MKQIEIKKNNLKRRNDTNILFNKNIEEESVEKNKKKKILILKSSLYNIFKYARIKLT